MLRLAVCLCWIPLLSAQDAEIREMLQDSVVTWNAGDLEKFASFYEDSPETTFIGSEVVRGGVADILGRYKRRYPTREAMGVLTFSNIRVRMLTSELGLVTGEFHLKRSAAGGGDASGRYTLVVRKTASGWKIIHDHTS
jgi:uncharacterized protein (TIGR02246 family)